MNKTIGIVGLGLIGGSLAKSLKANTKNTILGLDISNDVTNAALEQNAIDFELNSTNISTCDIILLSIYPKDIISFVKENINIFKNGCIIVDCAGVKSRVCSELSDLCAQHKLYFIGGHPMAGIEKSGFENSFSHLFDGATMILCRDENTNIVALKACEILFLEIGFLKVTITTADEHDKIIAFTSQLAHIVSNAYVKSETAHLQVGFSAGSYKDLTRVAYLNEEMWTELFLENKDNLIFEIQSLIKRLELYSDALKNSDYESLKNLLCEGKIAKERVG